METKKKHIIITILIVSVLLSLQLGKSYAQTFSSKKVKHAEAYYEAMDFKNALTIYKELYLQDSTNCELLFKIGCCSFNLRQEREKSLNYLKRASQCGFSEAYLYLGQMYHLMNHFEDALASYNMYAMSTNKQVSDEEVLKLKTKTITAIELKKSPVDVIIKNMGDTINSAYPDYAPLLSADGNKLFFTSRRANGTGGLQDPNGAYFEDIYMCEKKRELWSAPKSVSKMINTNTHEATVALSANGEKLYIYRTSEELTGGNIYITKFDGEDWTDPEKLDFAINTEEGWESSASITAEENTFYFSSNREGGFGGKDIYRIMKLPNGSWSKALNLGPVINTQEDEDFPFIQADGRTLYFSSKGHLNMGGFDVFKTTVDSLGGCVQPENIGYPINTTDDDVCFIISADASIAYYSSDRKGGKGETDIYAIKMLNPESDITIIKGYVKSNDASGRPLGAKLTMIDDETNEVKGIYHTNSLTGKYLAIVLHEKRYKLLIETGGYHPKTEYFKFNSSQPKNEIGMDFKMDRLK